MTRRTDDPTTERAASADIDRDRRRQLRARCEEFLYREAQLLDDFELAAWLDLLTEDIEYVAPVRVTRAKGSGKSEFKNDSFLFDDGKEVLTQRVDRLQREYAWVENPTHRTRRIVGNVRITGVSTTADDRREITLRNNLHLTRSREDDDRARTESAERFDTLRERDGQLALAARRIQFDHTVTGVLTTFY